ncbi:helix-turn-helix transcriptional regulator [Rhizobium sp. KVB221]|uniref:Helix-turn-helix transcriptional regulator n=1 Tax=Rhizobium setariae TaxID=2801340 RepID=A0A936YR61_9HYPH|nr:helix-turn-helix domain-containing protein [Rhizobium setariae]MBL0374163.1 helix-turn-helix transcriptional regulator [Rhizobium setariae]
MTPFGVTVRRIRKERGLTQKAMAKALGVSPAYLSALENGKKGRPGFDFLQRAAGYLNIIWDEADDFFRVASISHPRVVVDTSGLAPEYTAFANRLSQDIRQLRPETVREMMQLLNAAANTRENGR